MKVKVVKNKLAPPFRVAEFEILFNEGISHTGSVLDIAILKGIVEKKGAWISYNGGRLGQGREAAREELKKNPALCKEIEDKVMKAIAAEAAPLPAVENNAEVEEFAEA